MAPLARNAFLLALLSTLCLHQTGTAVPVDSTYGHVEKAGETPIPFPPESGLSTTNAPISDSDITPFVSDVARNVATVVLSQVRDTLQSAKSEAEPMEPLVTSVTTEAASTPATDSLSAPSTEHLSPSSSAVELVIEPPKTINVTLGDGTTRYTPAYVKANPGDTIMFNWVGKNNHSVTETDFLGNCKKSLAEGAFDSGVHGPGTQWNLTLPSNARGLKFFYCKVAKHCEMGGMSGTIIVPE